MKRWLVRMFVISLAVVLAAGCTDRKPAATPTPDPTPTFIEEGKPALSQMPKVQKTVDQFQKKIDASADAAKKAAAGGE